MGKPSSVTLPARGTMTDGPSKGYDRIGASIDDEGSLVRGRGQE